MKQKLKMGIKYVLMGGFLLVVSALLLVAVSHVGRFYRPMRTPVLERLGLPGIALALLALAAILFAVVFRHPRRLLAVSLLGILAFVVLNLVSGRHALPQILIWPSPRTLSERYVQALAADDLEAALQLTHPSHECHQIMTQQFLDQRAQLTGRLGDGWSESDFRHSTAKRITISYDDHMPQQLVHIQVETEAGRTAWLTLRMRYKPLLGARYICGTGIDPEATSVVVFAPTVTLAPTATLDETTSAETTPAPTEESANEQTFGELGPPPDGWERYTSTRWGVSFAVPAVWQEEEADHFVGEDGFARLERFAGPGLSVDQACEWEANFLRERYGPEPGLQSLAWENSIHTKGFPCLILGSLDDTSEFQSAILLTNPRKDHKSRFLILRVDTAHAETVARSLSYRLHVPPRPTSSGNSYLATPSPEEVPDDLPVQTSHYDELTLEEYAVIDASVDGPGHLEFLQRIPPAVLEKRHAWRDGEAIEPYLPPVEVGGERVTVEDTPYRKFQRHGGVGSSMYVSVQKAGTEVYRYNMLMHAGSSPLHYLGNWDGQWVLEVNGMLIVDGKIVNQDWGYDEIFGAQLLNEKPFYFFVQDGETRAAYDGQVLPVAYDDVFHGMCCEPGVFNVAGNSQMVWFYALRAGVWHYVELGVYD